MKTVAALYIDPRGPYPSMPGVDCWDAARDAREYWGPHPVVAHPPCGPWSRLRHLYQGKGGECAAIALYQVRILGGVFEHPVQSQIRDRCFLPKPGDPPDRRGGYSIEVDQCDWGHVARKRTWLYLVRIPRDAIVLPPKREPTHWASGSRGKNGANSSGTGGGVPVGIKVCSSQQRRRTPPAFAAWLIELARHVEPRAA